MLVRKGVGVVGGGVVPGAPGTVTAQDAPTSSSGWDAPWQCLWIPFYRNANPSVCQNYRNPSSPVAPVVPAGALDPGGVTGSVDQVVTDTAGAQASQTQGFFANLASSLGLQDPTAAGCDPAAFWCNWGNLVVLAGFFVGGMVVINLAKGVARR